MKLFLITVMALIAAFTLSAAELEGTWEGSMETKMGATNVIITIQPRTSLAGKVKIGEYEASTEKGKFEGEQISFEINIDPGKMTFEGTVSGDEMKLKCHRDTGR